jgi:pyrophosphate--fructose-6-phosphate 1-phosphotransferase
MTSLLEKLRRDYKPALPSQLQSIEQCGFAIEQKSNTSDEIKSQFPHLSEEPLLKLIQKDKSENKTLKVAFVFSGGQAAGGHNVASGLFDALKKLNTSNELIGFLDGPKGILENNSILITSNLIDEYRNMGGFDLVGSGRTKIETEEQFKTSAETVKKLNLDGLVIIGGDDSNTNAALLAEYFLKEKIKTKVVGVPKTIDGDLKTEDIVISFGFDSATKTYSEIIGNIQKDALSAKKYTFFIKLMGRTASHIALECALKTQPNLVFIGEEIEEKKLTLKQITDQIVSTVIQRSKAGKDYGVFLFPEGLLEFIPECKLLIQELNNKLSPNQEYAAQIENIAEKNKKIEFVISLLSVELKDCFVQFPPDIQLQLLLDRDPHGNVQVSKIDTERLFIALTEKVLKDRNEKVKFSPQPLFCGYEGRACLPSNFDANYCYSLGHVATLLIQGGKTGYICCIKNLTKDVSDWTCYGIPLAGLIHFEKRHGKNKPVIKKALVDLSGIHFKKLKENEKKWELEDHYLNPGPIQFFGPKEITDSIPITL